MLESAGLSFRDADRILERVRAVTADEVRDGRAATTWSTTRLTVATLDPQPMTAARPRPGPGATRH